MGTLLESLPRLGMDDVEHATEAFEHVEFGFLVGTQRAGTRLGGELVNSRVVAFGELKFEKGASGARGEFPLKFNDPLPMNRILVNR